MRQQGKLSDAQTTFDKSFIEKCLSTALDLDSSTGAISVTTSADGITVVPHFPSTRVVDMAYYEQVYHVLAQACYPFYTVLKPAGMTTKPLYHTVKTKDGTKRFAEPATARGLFFPWIQGTASRLVLTQDKYDRLSTSGVPQIPLMHPGLTLDFDTVTHVAISGQSGSGKSYFLKYLLPYLASMGTMDLVDPKQDDLYLWYKDASRRGLVTDKDTLLWPAYGTDTDADFLREVKDTAAAVLERVHERQSYYSDEGQNPDHKRPFKHHFFIIDELMALTQGADKKDRESFFKILQSIALLGRSSKVHLILVSQRFSADALPTAIREQLQAIFQLGPITKVNTQFLFPDYDPSGITIPPGMGTGLCQIQSADITYPQPFMSPTIKG